LGAILVEVAAGHVKESFIPYRRLHLR
jgi:hypothetical protein